jgi:uncharacterized membrane protein
VTAAGSRIALGVAAAVVFLLSWAALDHSFWRHGRIVDTPYYQGYGLQIRLGAVPYRDFAVEYPPGALPVFVIPTYLAPKPTDFESYQTWFARLMAVCGLACLAFVLLARPPTSGVVLVAISPLLVGPLVLTRFDLWPAAFVAASVAAFVHDRHRLGWLALALAVTAKLYAVVLLPVALVWTLRRRDRDELWRGLAILAVTVVAVFAPFAVLAPHGLWKSISGQLSRPIQVESLVASLLTTFGHPGDALSNGSVGIVGHRPLGVLTTVVEIACLTALWVAFARGPVEPERFARYSAACLCAFVALGKVLSPQYLIWLVPLVALVRGRRGLAASGLLVAALVGTQFYIVSGRYAQYIADYRWAPLVLGRNVVLLALLAVLALPPVRVSASPVSGDA